MKTEKNTRESETFTKNVNDAMKWFQSSNATMIDAYTKQMEFATDICNKALNTATEFWNPAFDQSLKYDFKNTLDVQKKMMEIVQKNIQSISDVSKSTLGQIIELGKKNNSADLSKETFKKIFDSFTKQADAITSFNENYFESINKQFGDAKKLNTPFIENLKKEFEANIELSKKELDVIIDSYKKLAKPSMEANMKMMDEMNSQMNSAINTNMKLWSELINHLSSNGSHKTNGTKKHTTSTK
ncbi:MAG TPA: hypothetical protein VII99_01780 [Bacteroidia bacterium]